MATLAQKLRAGQPLTACIQVLPSADVTEVLAGCGFDALMLDQEHGSGGLQDAIAQLRALKGTGVAHLVRVPSHESAPVRRLLDAGVDAILFPAVESAAQAARAVAHCRYPPAGDRGAGGGLRATGYDRDMDYYGRANDEILVGVQIETVAGVEAAAEIAAVPGVGLVVLGPRDLSASMGRLGRFSDPEVQAAFARAEAAVRQAGGVLGSVIYPGLTARDMFERGHRLVLCGTDVGFLARAAISAVRAARGVDA